MRKTRGNHFTDIEMMPPPQTLDLARRILAVEGKSSTSKETTPVIVYQKLRAQLSALVGAAGYQALLSRALSLAKAEAPGLNSVQVTEEGYVRVLNELDSQIHKDDGRKAEVILLAQLLGLILIFIGETLTLRLVRDVAPHLTVTTKSGTSSPFETILQEAGQLKKLSERLESLAAQHPAVEDALMSVSANINNSATLLEVFAKIKDESARPGEKVPKQQAGLYIM